MPDAPVRTIDAGTRLAIDRTHLAHERTLMAWVRTSTSLISFGFTIYKFFQYMVERGKATEDRLIGPREYALIMIAIGLASLAMATIQHQHSVKVMRAEFGNVVPASMSLIVAGLFSVLGILALLAVLLHR
jgi:putative membrane protein